MMTRVEFMKAWKKAAKNRCFYCGIKMTKSGRITDATVEHVYPKVKYSGLLDNTTGACFGCNMAKNGFPLDQFRQYRSDVLFCEKVLGEPIPSISHGGANELRSYFILAISKRLVCFGFRKLNSRVPELGRIGPYLKQRLKRLIR